MLYRHWKKFALVLTGLFWVGCESDAEPLYGVEAELPESSSGKTGLSGSAETDSSSFSVDGKLVVDKDSLGSVVCLYGVSPDIKFATLCYNDSIRTEEGRTFKIIDCTDGNKYMRSPNEANTEAKLPEGVQVFAPEAGSEKAINCKQVGDICIERNPYVEQDSLAGCHPVIDCPAKPVALPNCYNGTAKNSEGRSFEIFECDNGKKYLADPSYIIAGGEKDLPESVIPQVLSANATANCSTGPSLCVDAYVEDDQGNRRPVGGCFPTTVCPSKPEKE